MVLKLGHLKNNYHNFPKIEVWFYNAVKHLKDADCIANSVDPTQTAPFKEQSDLGLHCLLRPICPNTKEFYGTYGP